IAILFCLCLLRGQLRSHFVGDCLFDLGSHSYRCRGRRGRISTVVWVTRCGVCGCLLASCIGRLQFGCNQIIREPERWPGVRGIRRKPAAVETIPRRSSPTPQPYAPEDGRAPGMVAPAIESWVIPETGMVAEVHMTVPVVAAIDAAIVMAVVEVRTRIIGMAAEIAVGTLHVSAMPARVHYARSVVHTHHRAPTVQSIANLHAVAVDRSNLSVGADARGTTTAQRNVSGSCRRMSAHAATWGWASACGCAATCGSASAFSSAAGLRSASAFGSVSTLRCVSALRCMSTLRSVSALRCMSALRCVSALRCMSALRSVSALRPVSALRCMSALRFMSASAALCWRGVGCRLARTGFVLLLLRRSTSRSHCGYGKKN